VDPTNGIWIVWQATLNGQTHPFTVRIAPNEASFGIGLLGARTSAQSFTRAELDKLNTSDAHPNRNSSWQPSAVVTSDGTLHAIWDAFNEQSFDVLSQTFRQTSKSNFHVGNLLSIAATPHFEA